MAAWTITRAAGRSIASANCTIAIAPRMETTIWFCKSCHHLQKTAPYRRRRRRNPASNAARALSPDQLTKPMTARDGCFR